MYSQDTKFNYKVVLVALTILLVVILAGFYSNYSELRSQITFLEMERELLKRKYFVIKSDRDSILNLREKRPVELQNFKNRVKKLSDSVEILSDNPPKSYASTGNELSN